MGDRTAMTGEWLAHCRACPVPEIANVFRRARIEFHQITGILATIQNAGRKSTHGSMPRAWPASCMHNRLGVMGHYYCGMLDIYSDTTQQCAHFGGHMEILEVEELAALRARVTAAEIAERVADFRKNSMCRLTARRRNWNARRARRWRSTGWWTEQSAGFAGLLPHGSGQRGKRRCHQLDHPRQSASDRPRHPGRRRVRNQERAGHEDHGQLRRGRILHRVLCCWISR